MSAPRRLMVIVPDRLSELVAKGEITTRYYNPGDVFDEVHLVLVNDDRPDANALRTTVGRAELHLHNLPDPRAALFLLTLGWRPALLRIWARRAVRIAGAVQPDLIRCHAAQLNAFAAAEIKRRLGIPYVVSLHINPAVDLKVPIRGARSMARRVVLKLRESHARRALRQADAVVCVYAFIEPYARRAGARRIEVLYNVVSPGHVPEKLDYALAVPARVVIVGRQIPDKDPSPVLHALVELPDVHLTLVGTGSLHEHLCNLADRLRVATRTTFIASLPNEDLLSLLATQDVLVSVNDYGGVSKVELEAAHIGLPVVTNGHPEEDLPEVLGANCIVVIGTPASYRDALRTLLDDAALREGLGHRLRASMAELRPEATEEKYAELYRSLLPR